MSGGPGWNLQSPREGVSAPFTPAEGLFDRLVVHPEPATAKPEAAKPRDFGCKPLIKGSFCLSQRELQADLGRGSNSFRPCPPSRGDPQTGPPSAFLRSGRSECTLIRYTAIRYIAVDGDPGLCQYRRGDVLSTGPTRPGRGVVWRVEGRGPQARHAGLCGPAVGPRLSPRETSRAFERGAAGFP